VKIFLTFLVAVVAVLLLVKLMASMMGRITERILTGHFRALEAIVELDKMPQEWGDELKKMAEQGTVRTRQGTKRWEDEAKPFLMKKMKILRNHFEKSRFLEGPETRQILLSSLDEVRDRWNDSELLEILKHYDLKVDG
jgi:hypothetical protein|tara:strand:+ start:130 stop:546 length:417 start_codon:yes stop_codon:yes gene_type:complete